MSQSHNRKAYFVGKNIGSLLGAFYLIKYCQFQPQNVIIYDNKPIQQYIFNSINYVDNFSLYFNGCVTNIRLDDFESLVFRKTHAKLLASGQFEYQMLFNNYKDYLKKKEQEFEISTHKYEARKYLEKGQLIKSRIIDKNSVRIDLKYMGLNIQQQKQLLAFFFKPGKYLYNLRISDYFDESFFQTKLWLVWSSAFYFQPWHSAHEFRKHLQHLIHQYHRVVLLNDLKITPYDQMKYLIVPSVAYLSFLGVQFVTNTICRDPVVEDFDNRVLLKKFTVDHISLDNYKHHSLNDLLHLFQDQPTSFLSSVIKKTEEIELKFSDIALVQNGSVLDGVVFGSQEVSPAFPVEFTSQTAPNFTFWQSLAKSGNLFGDPSFYISNYSETLLGMFQVEISSSELFAYIARFQNTSHDNVSVLTFKDSNWGLTIHVFRQPVTLNQQKDMYIVWGTALAPQALGNYVYRQMTHCTGAEVFFEVTQHLRIPPHFYDKAKCTFCVLPFGTSPLQRGKYQSKPQIVPEQVVNVGLISHFVHLPRHLTYTIEGLLKSASLSVQRLNKVILHVPYLKREDNKVNSKLKTIILGVKNVNYTEQQRKAYISEYNFQRIIAIIGTFIALFIGYSVQQ